VGYDDFVAGGFGEGADLGRVGSSVCGSCCEYCPS